MSKKTADYDNNKVTNLNLFYPDNLKNEFVDALNETIFNRFLTKNDERVVIGAIGKDDLTSTIRNILESNLFAQQNQLQPCLTASLGSQTLFLTWQDFLNRLRDQDVDVDNLDSWGKATQFNWVPPIDLDKFINFRDYYWDTTLTGRLDPDYVTIKNRSNSSKLRLQQQLKTVSDTLLDGVIAQSYDYPNSTITINGNGVVNFRPSLDVVVKYVDGTYELRKVAFSTFDAPNAQTIVTLNGISDKPVYSIVSMQLNATKDLTDPTVVNVSGGDFTDLIYTGYICSLINSTYTRENFCVIESSEYNTATNTTSIKTNITVGNDVAYLNLAPLPLVTYYELSYSEGLAPISSLDSDRLYKIFWANRINKIQSSFGSTSDSLETLTDTTVDFVAAGVQVGDVIDIGLELGSITATVSGVTTNVLYFESIDSRYIFSFSNIPYKVYSTLNSSYYFIEPSSPVDGDMWVDFNTNTLKVRVSGTWNVVSEGVDLIWNLIEKNKIPVVSNAWIEQNAWIHKTQISSVAGKIRAQTPIIEYWDTLSLADTIRVDHDWSYRRNEDVSYSHSSAKPNSFEIHNIQRTGVSVEFGFTAPNIITFASKYGNMTDSLVPGTKIVLSGFEENDGVYEIVTAVYTQPTPTSNKMTVVTLLRNIPNVVDNPIGCKIAPQLTSKGDTFISPYVHWRYDGINNTYSTSESPSKNDIYDLVLNRSTTSKSGYNWQSFSFVTGGATDPILNLDPLLHTYCLYDDYQEGDIRVYINKVRQYGNFIEIPSYIDDRYVGAIRFVGGITLSENDVVLVEVGEYSNIDAGKRSVAVNTPSGYELVNLSQYKRHEQIKTDISQQPEFVVYNSQTRLPHTESSKIFSYVEDQDQPINPYVKKKLAVKQTDSDTSFIFKQHLLDDGKFLAYGYTTSSGQRLSTIWKIGSNFEQYVPSQNEENDWVIPNTWFYNMHHENREVNSYVDLYTHFRSIINSQQQPGLPVDSGSFYYADSMINYGLGGTIKEHNGNLDLLASLIFNDDVTFENLVSFARLQYQNSLYRIQDIFAKNIQDLFWARASSVSDLTDKISEAVIDEFEQDSKYSYWFGDSSSFDGEDGIRNWILTLPMMGVVAPVKPYIIIDPALSLHQIVHHDGHRSNLDLSVAAREQLLNRILSGKEYATDTVVNDSQPYPVSINGRDIVDGDYLLRFNTTSNTKTLYRYNGSIWQRISISETLMRCILEVETRLYNVSLKLYSDRKYDLSKNDQNDLYSDKSEMQFSLYAAESNLLEPLSNKYRFNENNPFTWNYSLSTPSALPRAMVYTPKADWRQVYTEVFGTPYPHLEPWKMQGYSDKPSWWDVEYHDGVSYVSSMWNNILSGIVPSGYTLPNGNTSIGTPQVQSYSYLPVVTIPETSDGYTYGQLLPPYWNSFNNGGTPTIRSIFDSNMGDEISGPNLDFIFGQVGDFEYEWMNSISYNYDRLVIAFKLDPLYLISSIFGYEKYEIGCLELHSHSNSIQSGNRAIFHGDEYEGSSFISHGLNQWIVNYNRYQDLDAVNSKSSVIWKQSEFKLSYLFDSVIDTKTFDIRSELFDLTNRDYSILLKTTESSGSRRLDAVNLSLISSPSRFLGDVDMGWTVELSTIPQNKAPISYFGVQNYEVDIINNEFVTYADPLYDVDYQSSIEYVKISYNNTLTLNSSIPFLFGTDYTATITINGNVFNVITGYDYSSVEQVIAHLNAQIEGGYFELELGDIVLYANEPLSTVSIVDGNLFSTISGFQSVSAQLTRDAEFRQAFHVRGNKTTKYISGKTIEIQNSTNFDGEYEITSSSYDVTRDITIINVMDDVVIPNGGVLVDGVVTITDALGLPDEWITGTEIYFNSYGEVFGLSLERPYYIIRTSDYSFKIADSRQLAENNRPMDISSVTINGFLNAGRLLRTFKSSSGEVTSINWRIHQLDDRIVKRVYDGVSISGMQNVVDWLYGYSSYNEHNGFSIPNNYRDESGRPYSWELYFEKFIDWCFRIRTSRQQSKMEYLVQFSPSDDTIQMMDSAVPNWASGTSVVFYTEDGATLPAPFISSNSTSVPYYVIRNTGNSSIRLAYSSYDANRGIHIPFSGSSTGKVVIQVFEKFTSVPTFTFNPFKESVSIAHQTGISSNIFEDGCYVYSSSGINLNTSHLFVNRRDTKTDVTLLGSIRNLNSLGNTTPVEIAGLKVKTKNIEHILVFSDYTTLNNLIYDSFLGLRTPRFLVSFSRGSNVTKRPTMGGYVLNGNDLIRNIESSVDAIRYFYDEYKSTEGSVTTDIIRKSLGYDGPKDYMSSIGIGDKSQFIFWKSMIQNKGTNFAVNAFTNQSGLSNAEVDEFWAYKLATFGGSEKTEYPEMKLLARDAAKNELRIEFIPPNNSALSETFEAVSLTDMSRWWDQPEQIRAMKPYDTFFIDSKVTHVIDQAQQQLTFIRGDKYLILPQICDGVVVSYRDGLQIKILNEQTDYVFVNSRMIKFITAEDPSDFEDLSVALLTYDFDTQNVSKIIDRKQRVVIAEVPFWNPALGRYDLNYTAPIDSFSAVDPAIYTDEVGVESSPEENVWLSDKVGFVWIDTSKQGYVPYYDKAIMPSIDDRIFNWGKMAEWSSLEVYEWTKSKYSPEQWDDIAARQDNDYTIPDDERISGRVKKILYKNVSIESEPIWVAEEEVHVDVIAGLMTPTNTPQLEGDIEVYINGKYAYTRSMSTWQDYLYVQGNVAVGTYLHFVKKVYQPTEEEFSTGKYAYFVPHSKKLKINPITGNEEYEYYFWVKDKLNVIRTEDRQYTLIGIKNGLIKSNSPYMIAQGLRPPGAGYGLVFGNTFDEFGYELPSRYTQLVIKGLEGKIKDDGRYTLRFTKDFNLRDKLRKDSLSLKNLHTEWKLFRERQFNKIDRYLWNKMVESMVGYKLTGDTTFNPAIQLPSLNRVVYDRIYGADTRIGLDEGQVFVDAEVAKATISSIIVDQIIDRVNDSAKDVLNAISYETPEDIISSFNSVYTSLDAEYVNKIFFAVLYDAMAFKREHAQIFKTSWVALQISQNVDLQNQNIDSLEHNLADGEACAEFVIDETPIVTPVPSPTPTPAPSSTPAVTPTVTPTITPSVSVSAVAVSPTPTPVPTVTPTPSSAGLMGLLTETGDNLLTEDNQQINT